MEDSGENLTENDEIKIESESQSDDSEISKIYNFLKYKYGVNFNSYRQTTTLRRISKRMSDLNIKTIDKYFDYLYKNSDEGEKLFNEMLITVTKFFRDSRVFTAIQRKIIPNIFKNKINEETIRIWIPGCSTGEEVYSIAILFLEFMEQNSLSNPIQIFGSDLSDRQLAKARVGFYSRDKLKNVSGERLKKYFIKIDGGYKIQKGIRSMCIFAHHDLTSEPPFSNIDLISCRNLLIYLDKDLQNKVIPVFHFSLRNGGYLVIGNSETIGDNTNFFIVIDKKEKIFQKKDLNYFSTDSTIYRTLMHKSQERMQNLKFNLNMGNGNGDGEITQDNLGLVELENNVNDILHKRFAPPCVLINDKMDVIQFRGKLSDYLEIPSGKASYNIFQMVKDNLMMELKTAIHMAKKTGSPVKRNNIEVKKDDKSWRADVEVIPVNINNGNTIWDLILFEKSEDNANDKSDLQKTEMILDGDGVKKKYNEFQKLKNELIITKDYLHSVIEEQEITDRELKVSSEKILSNNQELQSANEELETAKEELQSTNEELNSANEELQLSNIDLDVANNDLSNILDSVKLPIILIGSDLRIRKVTRSVEKKFNIMERDIGRPISHFKIPINISNIEDVLKEVISNKSYYKTDVKTDEGYWYSMRVSPYITNDHKVEGLVIVFVGIDNLKRSLERLKISQAKLKKRELYFKSIIEESSDAVSLRDATGKITYVSASNSKIFGYKKNEFVGKNWLDFINPNDISFAKEKFEEAIKNPGKPIFVEYRFLHKDGTYRWIEGSLTNRLSDAVVNAIVVNYRDVTDKKDLEKLKDEFASISSHELRTPLANIKWKLESIIEGDFGEMSHKLRHEVKKLEIENQKLINLVNRLLDVSKVHANSLKGKKEKVALRPLVKDILGNFKTQIENRSIKVKVNIMDKVDVHADYEILKSVIANLIENAIKYNKENGQVIVYGRDRNDFIEVEVIDTGIGISDADKKNIFKKFYRTREASALMSGVGLGLYSTNLHIKRMGGTIDFKSSPGLGSRFKLILPKS